MTKLCRLEMEGTIMYVDFHKKMFSHLF